MTRESNAADRMRLRRTRCPTNRIRRPPMEAPINNDGKRINERIEIELRRHVNATARTLTRSSCPRYSRTTTPSPTDLDAILDPTDEQAIVQLADELHRRLLRQVPLPFRIVLIEHPRQPPACNYTSAAQEAVVLLPFAQRRHTRRRPFRSRGTAIG